MKRKKKLITYLLSAIFVALLVFLPFIPNIVNAQSLQVSWPDSPLGTSLTYDSQLHEFIAYLYEWGIGLGGLAVFAMLLVASFQYMTSSGDPAKMKGAMKRITSAVLGLAFLLSSWLILNTINPQLTTLRKLPSLWSEDELYRMLLSSDEPGSIPCYFLVFYEDVDYGGVGRRFKLSYKEGNLPSWIDSEIFTTKDEDGDIIVSRRTIHEDQDGIDSIAWLSMKSFTKLTKEDREAIALEDEIIEEMRKDGEDVDYSKIRSVTRYNELGVRDDNGNFKEGGSCVVDFYARSKKFFGSMTDDVCGVLIGKAQQSSPDIVDNFITRDRTLRCMIIKNQ